MHPTLKKMNYQEGNAIVVLQQPQDLAYLWAGLPEGTPIAYQLEGVQEARFMLAFVTQQTEVDTLAEALSAIAEGDAQLWFAYPKGSSKRYRCDFNRDTGWDKLGHLGWEGVRQIAIDEDWSALRFRKATYIKKMTRDEKRALSTEGKAKLQ